MNPTNRAVLLSLLAALTGSAAAQAERDERAEAAYQEALARYKVCQARLPFMHHTEGRKRLANTRDPRALAILIEDYQSAKSYPEFTRYSIAHLFGRHFDAEEFVPQFAALRQACDKPVDMWLWVQTLRIHINRVGDADVVEIAMHDKDPLKRAAAILALGSSRNGRIKNSIVAACLEFPRKAADRCALLGAMSGALHENKRYVNDPDYRSALEAYISLLDPKVGLTHTSKIQMARHLQWILKGPALFVNPEPWLELLSRGEVKQVAKQETSASPSFFGIATEGERFCYVVDMSDSMCKLIEPSSKPATTTGPRPKRKKDVLPTESDLPWHLINSRWDLAREQLRISLLRLPDDKYFSVVWFGTDAGTLDACKGMVRATKRNVDRVIEELDSINPGPKDPVAAPDGQLRGKTNLHDGLRLAFALSKKGFAEEAAYVDADALTDGCDTIFLLSDGAPSWDGFSMRDTNYKEGQAVLTTEYHSPMGDPSHLVYFGPYHEDDWLVEDVERMNAFRRIRMHCVGLGEANTQLLGRLAKMCNGETFWMGSRSK